VNALISDCGTVLGTHRVNDEQWASLLDPQFRVSGTGADTPLRSSHM
jgi:hypothetical protein